MQGYVARNGQTRTWRVYVSLPNGEYVEVREEWESETGARRWMRAQGLAYKGEEFPFISELLP